MCRALLLYMNCFMDVPCGTGRGLVTKAFSKQAKVQEMKMSPVASCILAVFPNDCERTDCQTLQIHILNGNDQTCIVTPDWEVSHVIRILVKVLVRARYVSQPVYQVWIEQLEIPPRTALQLVEVMFIMLKRFGNCLEQCLEGLAPHDRGI